MHLRAENTPIGSYMYGWQASYGIYQLGMHHLSLKHLESIMC